MLRELRNRRIYFPDINDEDVRVSRLNEKTDPISYNFPRVKAHLSANDPSEINIRSWSLALHEFARDV